MPGLKSDFVIYNEQFWGGVIEILQQNTEAFNQASNNAVRLVLRSLKGDYEKESFLKNTASLISRRDTLSSSAVSATKLTQGEFIGVKVNRRLGPVDMARDAFRKLGVDPQEFSYMLGVQSAPQIAADYINLGLSAVVAAVGAQSGLIYDATAQTTKTANHNALVMGMSKFGDKASRLVCFVAHSKPYFDLMAQQITDKLYEVAGATVYNGTIATFGKPVVVLDSPALVDTTSTAIYKWLALTEGAVEVAESEEKDIMTQPVLGQENIVDRIQGEYALNLRVKGCAYHTATGENPTDAAVATGSNWDKVCFDLKLMPGTMVKFN